MYTNNNVIVYRLLLVPHTNMILVNPLSSTVPQTILRGGILKAITTLVRAGVETVVVTSLSS